MRHGRFRYVWDAQLNALRSRVFDVGHRKVGLAISARGGMSLLDPWSEALPFVDEFSPAGAHVVRCGLVSNPTAAGEVIRPVLEADAALEALVGRPPGWMVGRPMSVLLELLIERFGDPVEEP